MSDRVKRPLRKYPIVTTSVICNEGTWERSEFPHPLVTLDYDAQGVLLQVVVLGSDLRVGTDTNDPIDLAMLKGNLDLPEPS